MNLAKCLLGAGILGILIAPTGLSPMSLRSFLLLGASALVGIALGDTFFFNALVRLGPRSMSLFGTSFPAVTALGAVIFLGERLPWATGGGIALTTAGIIWVLWENRPGEAAGRGRGAGIACAALSVLCSSLGFLLAKLGVAGTSALQAAFVRLLWAAVGLSASGYARAELGAWLAPLRDRALLKRVFLAVFIVTLGGFWLSLAALKRLDASISGTLGSTSPIFVLPLAAILLREHISYRAILGALMAVGGVALICAR